jgi:hypothetical protein
LAAIGALFCFFYGLFLGILANDSEGSGSELLGVVLMFIVPNVVFVALMVLAEWRGVSAPAFVGALFGGILGVSLVLGVFSSVAVTDETLAEFGGDETWNSALGVGIIVYGFMGAFVGFIEAIAIALVRDTLTWLSDHLPKIVRRRRSPA